GVSLDAATGRYSGTPTTAGRHAVSVTVTDAAGRTDRVAADLVTRPVGPVLSQVVDQPGFELKPGPVPWSATSGVLGQTLQPARTGVASAWLGGTGFAHRDTLSQVVPVPAGGGVHTLSFWVRVETSEWRIGSGPGDTPDTVAYKPNPEGPVPWPKPWPWPPCPCPPPEPWGPLPDPWDLLVVEVQQGPYPEPWVALDVLSDFDVVSGYQLKTYDVSAFAGTSVTLRLTAVEDTGATTSFVVDDVAVETT
ncbi:MAG: hypothetical protein HOV94_14430, partial [Saccharothrix sp.]|nr:hypothetical protein [Saccharothrix sp.]